MERYLSSLIALFTMYVNPLYFVLLYYGRTSSYKLYVDFLPIDLLKSVSRDALYSTWVLMKQGFAGIKDSYKE